ncbi:MobA/MobL family protein [Sphingomonas corticis]|uniref:MobA/MobL family protein n=1 Tax=Sphingomonas corticis TaxID=2722791 RepID=A0ABX1CLD1_9SPHN|nr:MobA/MobL family protein [Sphingomonas corticis]NJR78748.1 MobA/MobL family protein [Sphingomonas corticis]
MTPDITKADVDAMKRILFARPRDRQVGDHPDFAVRPISEAWRLDRRMPAYKTAVANVAYIWRDSDAADRFGPMPAKFAERRCELRGAGLMLPASAPLWATRGYDIWEEADAATVATGDPTAVAAWHVMMEIPASIRTDEWRQLVNGFVAQELAGRGAGVAWAIHALEGLDGWIVNPHSHLIVTGLHWRRDYRHGQRHPAWIGSWQAQRRLELAWRRRCLAGQQIPSSIQERRIGSIANST